MRPADLPGALRGRLRRIYRRLMLPDGFYKQYRLSAEDIENGRYKEYFYGGAENWERLGAFQLRFLQQMELRPFHKLLDVGCGPIRAGVHFIQYLDRERYVGVDYNPDFLRAAAHVVVQQKLAEKHPRFEVIEGFDFGRLEKDFDFALAFAVIEHCNRTQQRRLFACVAQSLRKHAKLYVSHGSQFHEALVRDTPLVVTRRIEREDDLCAGPQTPEWGTHGYRYLFPIIELTRT